MKMKFKLLKKSRKRSRAPLGAGLAIGLGAMLAAWGYRRWARKTGTASGIPEGAGAGSAGEGIADPDAARLSEKFHSLDREPGRGEIPADLERDPKNIEQTIHP